MKKRYAITPLILFAILVASFVIDLLQAHAAHNRRMLLLSPVVKQVEKRPAA